MGNARRDTLAAFVTEYADQGETPAAENAQPSASEHPEAAPVQGAAERVKTPAEAPAEFSADSLSEYSDDDLSTYAENARAEFAEIYGDGNGTYTAADVDRMKALREVALSVKAERERRATEAEPVELPSDLGDFASEVLSADESKADAAESETDEANGEFAKKAVAVADDEDEDAADDEDSEDDDPEDDSEDDEDDTDTPKSKKKVKSMTASAQGRGNSLARRNATPAPAAPEKTMKDVVFATGEKATPGTGIDWSGIGQEISDKLRSFPSGQYANAARSGRHLRQQFGVAAFNKPTDPALTIDSGDPMQIDSVLRHARDERRLPKGGSLTASGGWCAPSETIYDLCELESNDGLLSLPEVTVKRGGIQRTLGPNFADIFNNTGFAYTEAEDEAGNYDGNGGGEKPCYHVECADFENFRLNVAGLCLTAGLLQQQGYPELIARTARGALVAHNHKMSARYVETIENGSTPVVYPNSVPGATAPLLAAIEKQAQHIRYSNRMSLNATIEAVFPLWVHGVIREDLAQRQGTDLDPFSVSDQMINGWFNARGISPQFVYNWQDINLISADKFTAYPNEVKFLMYPAGTWVKGGSNVITLDTLYDSRLLGTNDYTALWSEESWMVVKMCQDSRVVTVPLCPNGVTNSGQTIDCGPLGVSLPAEPAPVVGNGETTSTTTVKGSTTTTTTV